MRPSVLSLAVLLAAAPLGAQQATAPASSLAGDAPVVVSAPAPAAAEALAPAGAPVTVAAPVRDAAVGARPAAARADRRADAEAAAAAAAPRRGYGRNIALMVTGGAAIVLGILAGGDTGGLLILGGAIVGGVGLYQYLQ